MAVKTRAQLKSENASDFPDNTTKLISPADLRGQMDDVVDSALFPEDGVVAAAPGDVNGMTALRGLSPIGGSVIHLNYHTTVGDLGAGNFYGVTGAAAGTYVDNGGTIIVPTGGDGSTAWLRVWDHVKAHVGWFGAKCDPNNLVTDDYVPVKKCFDLFTNGRTSGGGPGGATILTGIIDVGPGFNFSQPLIYGGSTGGSFKLIGQHSNAAGGQEKSLLRYTGPATQAAIIFYGAGQWSIEDINTYPQLALNGVIITTDNTYNNSGIHTTTHAITAGADVVVTPSGATAAERIVYLQPGCYLGVDYGTNHNGLGGGDNFEIVTITAVDTVAGTFTATFKKNHASGVLLGGGTASSRGRVNRCRLICPISPVYTTLSADTTIVSGSNRLFTITDITGITVGMPVRVGSFTYAEVVYPTTVTPGAGVTGSFEAISLSNHLTGAVVMYPTAGILFGNRLLGTVQVSEISFYDTYLVGNNATCYAGIRQLWSGNVKNFTCHTMYVSGVRVPFAFEQSSGQYLISGGVSGGVGETLFICPSAHMTVIAWEDESTCMWLVGQAGANASQVTFIGCTMQGQVPVEALDQIAVFSGNLTFIGCSILNERVHNVSLPVIIVPGIRQDNFPGSLAIINCHIANATLASMNFVQDVPLPGGGGVDVLKDGAGKITMLNCTGGWGGAIVSLPNIIPPLSRWQNTSASTTPSLAANTAGAIQTLAVSGAVLGDLVDVSFSQNLGEMLLRAWVSALDTVSYQFRNPTASLITLTSGTVKCRVKK